MDVFDTTIRLSMGLEDVNDLYEDICRLLDNKFIFVIYNY